MFIFYRPALRSADPEELPEKSGGLFGEQTRADGDGMVEVRIPRDTVEGPGVTSFRVRGGVDEAVYPGRMSSSGAHRAGLEGRVERASREPPTAETLGGPADGEQLCVSGRVVRSLPLVRCDRDHLPVPRHHRPDRDLTSSGGLSRGPQRKSHHL